MRGVARMALGVLIVFSAVLTIGAAGAVADEEVRMVFHVEGMR